MSDTAKITLRTEGLAAPALALALTEPERDLFAALSAAVRAPGTLRVYRSAWRDFLTWATARREGEAPTLPIDPGLVLAYVLHRASTTSPSRLTTILAAIGAVHEAAGFARPRHPELYKVLRGHRRTWAKAPVRAKALRKPALVQIVESIQGDGPRELRDRALLLVGFAGALRRSELAGIRIGDLQFEEEGVVLTIPRSKTDQEGRGQVVALHKAVGSACPVVHLRLWLDQLARWGRRSADQPLWCGLDQRTALPLPPGRGGTISTTLVVNVLRRRAEAAGIDPGALRGHSLRRGWITEAAVAGAHARDIRAQSRHKDVRTMEKYIDEASVLNRAPKVL